MPHGLHIRDVFRPGDLEAIVAHHGRVYASEHGVDHVFEQDVAAAIAQARAGGFPGDREAIRIVERDGVHAGSIALTDEGDSEAALRWVLLDADLRGHGLGRRLVGEMVATAKAFGYSMLSLHTFSELEAAAHLYREHGFQRVWADSGPRWGRARITYQRYELPLDAYVGSTVARRAGTPRTQARTAPPAPAPRRAETTRS